jgi:glycosyltransferase involved in cell wall biosynthesis
VTISAVVSRVLEHVDDVIVVDDGSTDQTPDELAQLDNITVLTQKTNQGKGAALVRGMECAHEKGFDYALCMDADGQHSAGDIPAFIKAINDNPGALILGRRNIVDQCRRAMKSKVLRVNSNFWTWVETGKWVTDTQSGYRAYPLEPISKLALKTTKYDFEIESLVKLLWIKVPLAEIDISVDYGVGSESHFRPIADFSLVFHLNAKLVWQRILLPKTLLSRIHLKEIQALPFRKKASSVLKGIILRENNSPARFALCISIGVFFGILPVWGFQMALAALVAHALKLSKSLTLVASNISMPIALPFILYASLLCGRFVLSSSGPVAVSLDTIQKSTVGQYAVEYLVGSVVLAALCSVVFGLIAYVCVKPFLRKG